MTRELLMFEQRRNFKKTKWVKINNAADTEEEDIKVREQRIERVNDYVHLGHQIHSKRNPLQKIRKRVQAGLSVFFKHCVFSKYRNIEIRLKRKVNTYILPAVLHGCET